MSFSVGAPRLIVALAAVISMSSTVQAQNPVRGIIRFGGEMGGDKVLEFTYEDGSTPDVPAGAGILLAGGAVVRAYESAGHAFEAQVTAGVKYRTIPPATNQEATWLRFPLEAMAFYRAPGGIRLGVGPTMHVGNTLKASGAVLNDEVTFKSSPGMVLQAEYVRNNLSFDARYTALKYEVQDGGSGEVDASSFGVGISFFFGGKARQ